MSYRMLSRAETGAEYSILEIADIAGLNTRDKAVAREPDECANLSNCLLVGRGIEKRPGSAVHGSAQTGDKVVGLGYHENDAGVTPLMTVNQTLYKYVSSAWAASDKTNYTANLDTAIVPFTTKSGSSVDSGTSSSGTTVYVVEDSSKSWTKGQYAGFCVLIKGEVKYINDNTQTQLILSDKLNTDVNGDYQTQSYSIFAIAPHAIICNGTDSPQKYNLTTTTALDGTHVSSGKAIPIAKYAWPHQGRLWYAEGSGNDNDRVYITDPGVAENITLDSNLNLNLQFFNDGDRVTGGGSLPLEEGSVSIVTKRNSVHAVEGTDILNYKSRPIMRGRGSIAPKSFCIHGQNAFFLSDIGVMSLSTSSNALLNDPIPISRPIQPDLDAMSSAQMANACGAIFENRYYLQVGGSAWYYDIEASLRQQKHVWVPVEFPYDLNIMAVINGVLYGGNQTSGQNYTLLTGTQDGSTRVTMVMESAEISLPGRPQMWVERVEFLAEPDSATVLRFQYATDGGSYGAVQNITLDNNDRRVAFNVQKRCYGFSFKLTENGTNTPVRISYPIRIYLATSDYGESGSKG